MSTNIDPDELIREIDAAFDRVPKPKEITLRVARGLDDYKSQSELDELRKVGSSRVDLQACKLEYSIVSPK